MPSWMELYYLVTGVLGGALLILGYQIAGRVGMAGSTGKTGPTTVFTISMVGFTVAVAGLTLVSAVVKQYGGIAYFVCLALGGSCTNTLMSQMHSVVLKRGFIPWINLRRLNTTPIQMP